MQPTRARRTTFGAWVLMDSGHLVGIDHALSDSLHVPGVPPVTDHPVEIHMAVTQHCPVQCAGCYQNASPAGQHLPRETLFRTMDTLAQSGVFTLAFGGGEPLSHPDILAIAAHARSLGLVPVVTTSGFTIQPTNVKDFAVFSQVNVSHDGVEGGYASVRGFDGSSAADRAIQLLRAHAISVGVNMVLTRESFDTVERTAEHFVSLGVRELQLLRYKPTGRAASLDYLEKRLSLEQRQEVPRLLQRLAERFGTNLSIRIDCSMVPFLSESGLSAQGLLAWGIFGCEAGRHLAAVDHTSQLSGCSFLPADSLLEQSTSHTVAGSAFMQQILAYPRAPGEPCTDCALASVCRGGCKVVSRAIDHEIGPDPECPRVVRFRASRDACVVRDAQ